MAFEMKGMNNQKTNVMLDQAVEDGVVESCAQIPSSSSDNRQGKGKSAQTELMVQYVSETSTNYREPTHDRDIERNQDGVPLYHHRDVMGRTTLEAATQKIRYLKPGDGKISELTVQSATWPPIPEYDRWKQVPLKNKTPWVIRMVYWLISSVPHLATGDDPEDGARRPSSMNAAQNETGGWEGMRKWIQKHTSEEWLLLYLKWPLGCIAIFVLLFIPMSLTGELRSNGNYDPVKYRYWGYPKKARNPQEEKPDEPTAPATAAANVVGSNHDQHQQGEASRSAARSGTAVRETGSPKRELTLEWDAEYDNLPARHLRPRYLCVLRDSIPDDYKAKQCIVEEYHLDPSQEASETGFPYTGFNKVLMKQWVSDFPDLSLEYIVVSYTREHFMTSDKESLVGLVREGKLKEAEKDERLSIRDAEMRNLFRLAEKAARDANVPAFYIDFMCMDHDTYKEDIHRICDVVRGANSLVIALNEPVNNRLKTVEPEKKTPETELDDRSLLRGWGARMWTVSEVLLSPDEHRIMVYRHGNLTKPKDFALRNFAVEAYKDPRDIRQLIDHYDGSLILTPLELVTIGLECLQSRLNEMIASGYSMWSKGDMSYALMALLRRRPQVNPEDSAFEAFAKLSLANDSNKLLERLICMLPPEMNGPWHDMRDAWGVKLWDIDPMCQVAGIAENQTVILDGAYGATIQWHSLAPVAFIKRATLLRTALKYCMRLSPGIFVIAVGLLASGAQLQHLESGGGSQTFSGFPPAADTPQIHQKLNGTAVAGIVIFLITITIVFASPYILLQSYKGKLWSTQAEFFGIEGVANREQVEAFLFGFDLKRLKWSTNSSLMSRHRPNSYNECIPTPPDTTAMQLHPGQRYFTLIDTYTMTATVFASERPPTTVMICGSEGGLQRAVLCSYEWQTQTFKRDTVLRMKTMVLDRMSRIDRFRFSLGGEE